MDRKPSDEKRRAIEGLLSRPPAETEQSQQQAAGQPADMAAQALPDEYQPTGLGAVSEVEPERRSNTLVVLVAVFIIVVGVGAAALILAGDHVVNLFSGLTSSDRSGAARSGSPDDDSADEARVAARMDRETIERLEAENQTLLGQLAELQGRFDRLQEQGTDSSGQERAPDDGRPQDLQSIARLEGQLEELRNSYGRLEEENSTLRQQITRQQAAARQRTGQLEDQNETLGAEVQSLTRDLQAARSQIAVLQNMADENQSASQQLQSVNEEYRRVMNLLRESRQAAADKDARIQTLLDENTRLGARAAELESSLEEMSRQAQQQTVATSASGFSEPTPTRIVRPEYPASARARNISGVVQVRVLVSEEGQVLDAEVVSSPDPLRELDRAALRAVRSWSFAPAMRDGSPVQVWYVVSLEFLR